MPTELNPATAQQTGKRIGKGRYELMSILGSGAYGVVYLALDLTSPLDQPTWYAVKCLAKAGLDLRQRKFQRREIALHQLASAHPGVVTLHCVIEESDFIYVVLDFCPDGDLFGMITEYQLYLGHDDLIRSVFLQIISAVEYCHNMGIHHRDLKPENILCKNGGASLLIADFGLATSEKTSQAFGCGSSFYMSPECQGGVFAKDVPYSTPANDVWALGVILVNLSCGRNPWGQAKVDDIAFSSFVLDRNFLRKLLPITRETNELLKRIFRINPQQRITLKELRESVSKITQFALTEEELVHARRSVRRAAIPRSPVMAPPPKAATGKAFLGNNGGAPVKVVRTPSSRDVTGFGRIRFTRTPAPPPLAPPATPRIPAGEGQQQQQRWPRRPASPYPQANAVPPLSPYQHYRNHLTSDPNEDGSLANASSSSSASDGSLILTPEVQPVQDTPLSVIPGGDLDGGDWGDEQGGVSHVVVVTKAAVPSPPTKAVSSPRGFLWDVVRKIRAL